MQHDCSKDRVETELTFEISEQSVLEERSATKQDALRCPPEPRVSDYPALQIFQNAPARQAFSKRPLDKGMVFRKFGD